MIKTANELKIPIPKRTSDTGTQQSAKTNNLKNKGEIKIAHENYEELKVNNEKPLEEMTLSELKEKINSMCLVTKLRKREKLVDFIKSNL